MFRNYLYKIIIFLMLILITGCSPSASKVPSQVIEDQTQLPNRVVTSLPNSTNTRTVTPVLMSTPPPIEKTQTPTVQPTLSADAAKKILFDLLQSNTDCKLPCVWGITPGENSLEDLKSLFAQFGNVENPNNFQSTVYENAGAVSFNLWQDTLRSFVFFAYANNNSIDFLLLYIEGVEESGNDTNNSTFPAFGNVAFRNLFDSYLIDNILSSYGSPSQVLIAPYIDEPNRQLPWVPFSVVLYYQDQGVFVEYISPKKIIGDNFIGCPVESAYVSLIIGNPAKGAELDDFIKLNSGLGINEMNADYFKPIDQTTTLTIDNFYQNFKESENGLCIETPVELWPKP